MTHFLRLLTESNKAEALATVSMRLRQGLGDPRYFDVRPESFDAMPSKTFAYWVSDSVRQVFKKLPGLEAEGRVAQHGGSTKDDFRFLRTWWEIPEGSPRWTLFAKGGAFSRFYADVYLAVNWQDDARELEAALLRKYPYLGDTANWILHRECNYHRPGLTWPLRTVRGLNLRVLPSDCIFGHKGPAAFVLEDAKDELLALLALTNSKSFSLLVSLQMAFGSYEVGVLRSTPTPQLNSGDQSTLSRLARRAWSLKRALDTTYETSHSFLLPVPLRKRLPGYDPATIKSELVEIQSKIDDISLDIYGFSEADCQTTCQNSSSEPDDKLEDEDEEDGDPELPEIDSLLSWAVGVAFGRFDYRFATTERDVPPEPDPFASLPCKSPGMLPFGAEPFHAHSGILVDEQGHLHDLAHLVEEVLSHVDATVTGDVRAWLRRDLFGFHLQRYSRSRRKAPIYWPLSTNSGNYTLWVYYPTLTSQTIYSAINDFVEPKLKEIRDDVITLRNKGTSRTPHDEKKFELLQSFELELIELRDILLKLAPRYRPNQDDGVQITAAPLWPLFRHKPWQKILKETWAKLEKGDYDWAHLAMNYWPERVREKCKADKSLAIAHGLEHLYIAPKAPSKKARGRKKAEVEA